MEERQQQKRTPSLKVFVGLLQLIFIVLKLCGVITWSWWTVMLPLIIYGGIWLTLFTVIFIIALISYFKERND